MCGIFGIFSSALPGNGIIRAALDSIRHRGPDDEGYVFIKTTGDSCIPASGSDTCSGPRDEYRDILTVEAADHDLLLAHRRLAIIDLSPQGHQPMSYEDGDLWTTYNGEIFNYRELRTELRSSGYSFNSDSDTEVVLAAYREWGERCVLKFNGQWAFCIYDRRQKRLFCSRDRFGIKPFYYCFDGRNFAFASEMKALLALSFVDTKLNRPLISDFVIFCGLDTSEETLRKGIYQLPPSHNLIIDMPGKRPRIERYYELRFFDRVGDYDQRQALRYADDIRDLLIDSVKIRLLSDVPVGTCLSGGLDSSSIVGIINKLLEEGGIGSEQIGERQKTFTAGYDDPTVDERIHADEVIRHTSADAYFCYPDAEGLWKELDSFLYHQDGPCFSTNIYPGWDVMRLASNHIRVVLNGEGGDEVFGGYPRYEILYLADMMRKGRFKDLAAALRGMGHRHGFSRTVSSGAISGCLAAIPRPLQPFFLKVWYRTRIRAVKHLLNERLSLEGYLSGMSDSLKSLNQFLISDTRIAYLPQLLHYDDRNAAAFSIENRVPFVDHRLVEYVSGIPSIYKLHRGWSKWLLRLAMRDLLPEKIVWRKDKLGFPTPFKTWLEHSSSTVPQLMKRYNIRRYDQFIWRLFLADRLISQGEGNGQLSS